MPELDEAAREDLAAFAEVCRPSARRRRANWVAIQARMQAQRRGRRRAVRVAAAVLLVAAGVMLWVMGRSDPSVQGRAEPRPSMSVDQRVDGTAGAQIERRRPATRSVDTVLAPDDEPAVPSRLDLPSAERSIVEPSEVGEIPESKRSGTRPARPASGASARERATAAPEPGPASSLAARVRAEAVLMDRARSALQAGRHHEVLRRLDEHRARFDAPFMAEEAAAWRAVALCRLGRVEAGRAAAAAFARAYPRSPHGSSVAASCAEDPVTDPPVPLQQPAGGL